MRPARAGSPGEVVLGSVTLDAVHKHIGNTVTVRGDTGTRKYLIVGRIVLPSVSSDELQPMADAASFTSAGLRPILSPKRTKRTSSS